MKLPGLKNIKKMSNDLAKSAKSAQIMDKIKNSVDSLATGASDRADFEETGDAVLDSVSACQYVLSELKEVNKIQSNLFNNLDKALSQLTQALSESEQDVDELAEEASNTDK
jgi:hypothetical protein